MWRDYTFNFLQNYAPMKTKLKNFNNLTKNLSWHFSGSETERLELETESRSGTGTWFYKNPIAPVITSSCEQFRKYERKSSAKYAHRKRERWPAMYGEQRGKVQWPPSAAARARVMAYQLVPSAKAINTNVFCATEAASSAWKRRRKDREDRARYLVDENCRNS